MGEPSGYLWPCCSSWPIYLCWLPVVHRSHITRSAVLSASSSCLLTLFSLAFLSSHTLLSFAFLSSHSLSLAFLSSHTLLSLILFLPSPPTPLPLLHMLSSLPLIPSALFALYLLPQAGPVSGAQLVVELSLLAAIFGSVRPLPSLCFLPVLHSCLPCLPCLPCLLRVNS